MKLRQKTEWQTLQGMKWQTLWNREKSPRVPPRVENFFLLSYSDDFLLLNIDIKPTAKWKINRGLLLIALFLSQSVILLFAFSLLLFVSMHSWWFPTVSFSQDVWFNGNYPVRTQIEGLWVNTWACTNTDFTDFIGHPGAQEYYLRISFSLVSGKLCWQMLPVFCVVFFSYGMPRCWLVLSFDFE